MSVNIRAILYRLEMHASQVSKSIIAEVRSMVPRPLHYEVKYSLDLSSQDQNDLSLTSCELIFCDTSDLKKAKAGFHQAALQSMTCMEIERIQSVAILDDAGRLLAWSESCDTRTAYYHWLHPIVEANQRRVITSVMNDLLSHAVREAEENDFLGVATMYRQKADQYKRQLDAGAKLLAN